MGEKERFRRSVYVVLSFIFIIWFIKALEFATDADFSNYGILPRTLKGSIGIFASPFIHGDIYHLISNTFPLIVLGIGILFYYPRIGYQVILLIYIMTGFWVWVAARDAFHIGASGIVYGMFAFLLLGGFLRRDRRTLAISFILLMLYGGSMFSGLVPTTASISWESHLMGFAAGIFCAIYFRAEKIEFENDHLEDHDEHSEDRKTNTAATDFTGDAEIKYYYTYKPNKKTDLNNKK